MGHLVSQVPVADVHVNAPAAPVNEGGLVDVKSRAVALGFHLQIGMAMRLAAASSGRERVARVAAGRVAVEARLDIGCAVVRCAVVLGECDSGQPLQDRQ